jgi:CxxC-x17-CxxC domain-containing protein
MQFTDRYLKCSDCSSEFVFTAGEQLFFYDKQFKNDPKRCKLCKAKRAGLGRSATPNGAATVPFKPTQGRPVLCRSCFQLKRVPSGVAAAANLDSPAAQVAAAAAALDGTFGVEAVMSLPPSSSTATMEMIAETPGMMMADSDGSAEVLVGSGEASRA